SAPAMPAALSAGLARPLGRAPAQRPWLRGAFGPGPHRAEYVPLVGIAADELLEAVNDRLCGVLDVMGGLLRPFDEDRRQSDAAESVVAFPRHGRDDDRRSGNPGEVRGDGRERGELAEEHHLDVVELF